MGWQRVRHNWVTELHWNVKYDFPSILLPKHHSTGMWLTEGWDSRSLHSVEELKVLFLNQWEEIFLVKRKASDPLCFPPKMWPYITLHMKNFSGRFTEARCSKAPYTSNEVESVSPPPQRCREPGDELQQCLLPHRGLVRIKKLLISIQNSFFFFWYYKCPVETVHMLVFIILQKS